MSKTTKRVIILMAIVIIAQTVFTVWLWDGRDGADPRGASPSEIALDSISSALWARIDDRMKKQDSLVAKAIDTVATALTRNSRVTKIYNTYTQKANEILTSNSFDSVYSAALDSARARFYRGRYTVFDR